MDLRCNTKESKEVSSNPWHHFFLLHFFGYGGPWRTKTKCFKLPMYAIFRCASISCTDDFQLSVAHLWTDFQSCLKSGVQGYQLWQFQQKNLSKVFQGQFCMKYFHQHFSLSIPTMTIWVSHSCELSILSILFIFSFHCLNYCLGDHHTVACLAPDFIINIIWFLISVEILVWHFHLI